jgi:peptidase M50B-like protein
MADPGMAWTTGLVAFVAAVPLWRFTTHVITIAHEGGHALFGVLFGRAVTHVKVGADRGGETGFRGGGWFGIVFSFLAGYLGPSIFGLSGAWMLVHGFAPRAVLLMSLALMAVLLVMVRNFFGFIAVPLTGAVLWATAMHASEPTQRVFAHIWVWFLLMGGVRQIPELYRVWSTGKEPDTAVLAKQTGCSTAIFVALFWAGSMAALIYGGVLLLRHDS